MSFMIVDKPEEAAAQEIMDQAPHDKHVSQHAAHEGSLALRNGLKLAASMILTWAVTLIVTFKLPKYLGPVFFGYFNYGEQLALSMSVFLTLGVDTYIQREIAVRPKHASEFFLGVMLARAMMLVPLIAYGSYTLHSKQPEEQIAGGLFGIAYIFYALNQTFQKTLQAASKVSGLAVANVVAKIFWGGGVFAAVTLKAPFWVLPLPLIFAEGFKAAFLFFATRNAIDLELRLDAKTTREVLKISIPFFIADIAVQLGSSIDVVVLRELMPASSPEVGWYSAARKIANLSMLLSPIMSGVLIPMMSRAKARSEDEFFKILRRGFEGVFVISLPLTLLLALGAEFWIHITIKDAFLPSTSSLIWLAPTFVFAYANVLLWLALMILDRSWTIMLVSVGGLVLLPVFIMIAVPITSSPLRPGSAGTGVAMALSLRELAVILVFLGFLRSRALDRRGAMSMLKSLGICVVVSLADWQLRRIGMHPALRLSADVLLYGVLAIVSGVVRLSDVKAVFRLIKNRKQAV
ncbi:MAG: oligosaccharide flippase family protein [Polyangiaceae bacterium]|nr:oligosaccharide flippase family protein [Polyangiaceae bacterium]